LGVVAIATFERGRVDDFREPVRDAGVAGVVYEGSPGVVGALRRIAGTENSGAGERARDRTGRGLRALAAHFTEFGHRAKRRSVRSLARGRDEKCVSAAAR
jgi:hypothetical protein